MTAQASSRHRDSAERPSPALAVVMPVAGTTDDVGEELQHELDQIGLSRKAGWYSSAGLYGAGGLVAMICAIVAPQQVPAGIAWLAAVALIVSGWAVYGAHRMIEVPWAAHVRICTGTLILLIGFALGGAPRIAFALLALAPMLSPAILYGPRKALFYVGSGVVLVFVTLSLTAEPAPMVRAIVNSAMVATVGGAMIVSRERIRLYIEQNRRLAYSDALTGLANMRRLRERLGQQLSHAERNGEPLALFAVDLDNFKEVNDRFDHGMGDRVLQAVARALASQAGPGDLVARRGGDEFSLLVARAADRDLDKLAVRLREAIGRAREAICPEVTPSAGAAYVVSTRGENDVDLLQRADDALHAAKGGSSRGEPVARADVVRPIGAEVQAGGATEAAHLRVGSVTANAARKHALLNTIGKPWYAATLVYGELGVLIGGVALGGLAWPLTPIEGGTISLAFLVLALATTICDRHNVRMEWIHLTLGIAVALLSAAIALAGIAGSGLVDLYFLLIAYVFFYFPVAAAAPWFFVCMAGFAGFAFGGDYPYAAARVVCTITVLGVLITLASKVRMVGLKTMRENAVLSEVDALTGLANIRALRRRVHDVVAMSQPGGERAGLIAVDLDDFKQVNDRHSHSFGDEVLVEVARTIAATVRVDELVARRGGDEFCVVCMADDPAALGRASERIGDAIEATRRRICPDVMPTATVAIAMWQPGRTGTQLLRDADKALHARKEISHRAREVTVPGAVDLKSTRPRPAV